MKTPTPLQVKSCGVILFRDKPVKSFLLMQHAQRLDLPKGHMEARETELECAFREMEEETGINANRVEIDSVFRFETSYIYHRRDGQPVHKTVIIFLGWLQEDLEISPSEHIGYQWYTWNPPHQLQTGTIDPLLSALERHFKRQQSGKLA
jgi:8-oxo-dGTP pyrophosphatase MutT (NUDIX family)